MSSFHLYDWLVEPEYNKLTRGSESHQLEPLAMDVLVFFAQNVDEVISRDQLVDAVWQGRIVGDHAIYRIINQLRKLLDESDEQKYFVTIRKKGYRFIAPVKSYTKPSNEANAALIQHDETKVTQPISEAKPKNAKSYWLVGSGLGVLLSLIGVAFWLQPFSKQLPELSKTTPVTNLPGEERSPAFSFDGQKIAFSHKATKSRESHIYFQSLFDNSLVQITTGNVDDATPKWSPNDKQIAFVRYKGKTCEILIQDLDDLNQAPLKLAECNGEGRMVDLAWDRDSSHLYYTNTTSAIEPMRVYKQSLETGKKTQITNPKTGKAKGDLRIALSPDGKQLAILRDYNWGNSFVLLHNLETGEEQKLFNISGWQLALSWSHDGKYLYYSNEKNTVDAFSIDDEFSQTVAKNIEPIGFPVSSPVENRVAIETGRSSIDVWAHDLTSLSAKESESFIVSSEYDLYPVFSSTSKRAAFISSRSGNLQVWIREENGREFQLTRFTDGRPIRRIRWSPDDRYLLSDRSKYLYMIDSKTGEEIILTTEEHWALTETPSWSRDGKYVYFSSDVDGDWQIYKMAAKKNSPVEKVTESGGYSAEESMDRQFIYYLKYHKPGLWKLNLASGEEQLAVADIDVFSSNAWTVTKQGIYYFSNDDKKPGIYLLGSAQMDSALENQEKQLITILPPLIKNFSVAYDHSHVIFPKFFQSESSIVMLSPKEN